MVIINFKGGNNMDIYEDLNTIWIDCVCSFLMLSFFVFIGVLIWQHIKNKREQEEILKQYNHNLKILQDLKNRF